MRVPWERRGNRQRRNLDEGIRQDQRPEERQGGKVKPTTVLFTRIENHGDCKEHVGTLLPEQPAQGPVGQGLSTAQHHGPAGRGQSSGDTAAGKAESGGRLGAGEALVPRPFPRTSIPTGGFTPSLPQSRGF